MTQEDTQSRTRPVERAFFSSATADGSGDSAAKRSRDPRAVNEPRSSRRGVARILAACVLTASYLLTLTGFVGCAGLERSIELKPDDRVVVQMFSPAGPKRPRDLRQTLCNENVVDRDEFYRARSTDPLTKVISNDAMQLLLDAFSSAGYFEVATERQLVNGWAELHVTINDAQLHLVCHGEMEPAHYDAYEKSAAAFLDLYNATTAYRSASGANSVLEEHQRAHRESRR